MTLECAFVKGIKLKNTELDTIELEAEVICPPSVSQSIWLAIPLDRRKEAVELAAINLRRAIHPDNTLEEFLLFIGVELPVPEKKFEPHFIVNST